MNLVTVIVPLYNPDLELLRASLDAILADSAVERIERIILVDDGSHIPITRDRLAIESDKIVIIRQVNKGPGGARNQGAYYASEGILVFLDQDCVPSPHWLACLLKPLDSGAAVAVMGAILSRPTKNRVAQYADYIGLLRRPSRNKSGSYTCMITANFAIQSEVFRALGGFDERLKIAAEDLDLTYRLIQRGYSKQLAYVEDAVTYHQHRERLSDFMKQQFGYGFATMSHCIIHDRDTRELGFLFPTLRNITFECCKAFVKSFRSIGKAPVGSFGFINSVIVFPFLEFCRQLAFINAHRSACRRFPGIKRELDSVYIRPSVRIILKDTDGKFLVMEKPDGTVGLAGGGVKKGESFEQALSRECEEELGLSMDKITDLRYLGRIYRRIKVNYHFDEAIFMGVMSKDAKSAMRLSSEHTAFCWSDLEAVPFQLRIDLSRLLRLKK